MENIAVPATPKNYWMFVQSPENFNISRERGFDVHGFTRVQRRRAQRMEPNDQILYYVSSIRKWGALGTIISRYYDDQTPVWNVDPKRPLVYRVRTHPSIVLEEDDYIDALLLGPRLDYVKRWVPEMWDLAFSDTLHLLPQRDFRLVEHEMLRIQSPISE